MRCCSVYRSIVINGIIFSCHLLKNDTSYYDSCQNSVLFKIKPLIGKPCTCYNQKVTRILILSESVYLFFNVYSSPSKYSPCDIMYLFQCSFQSEKHWPNVSLGIALSSTCDFAFISFILEKNCPSSVRLSLRNRKKSQGARSRG